MSSAKQHNISILNETELNLITTYLKGNIHVNYYIVYKLKNFENCWFIYFQHPNSIYPISSKFKNVYTLLYRGPSKILLQFIKTNGNFLTEYGKSENLNLKSSLKRELNNIEFIEPFDIVNKTLNHINEINKQTKKTVKVSNIKVVNETTKRPIQKKEKATVKTINQPIQETIKNIDIIPEQIINNKINVIKQDNLQSNNLQDTETPETDIEYTDIETADIEINKPKLDPFKENKRNQIVRIQPISKNDINIEYWKNNIHTDYKELQVIWVYGASDVDKTDRIKRFIKDNEEKYGTLINVVSFDGKYWKGVGEKAKIAIYDGFKETHMAVFEYLDFVDKEIHELPTLNGNIKNNYNLIIISSIFNPDYIYINYNEDIKDQIKKSINKVIKV